MLRGKRIGFMLAVCMFVLGIQEIVAQGVHPEVQVKIDSLQQWIQTELQTKGTIDQAALEDWNKRIREAQERLAREGTSKGGLIPGESKAEVKTFSGFVGTSFRVPEGKRWEVRKVTVSGGLGEYQILVTSLRFDRPLDAGAVLSTPSFTAEASLVTEDQSTPMYTFEILEYDVSK
jgi:hypothetical protein